METAFFFLEGWESWFIPGVLKTPGPVKGPVSSNLTPSAKHPDTTGIHKQVVNR